MKEQSERNVICKSHSHLLNATVINTHVIRQSNG